MWSVDKPICVVHIIGTVPIRFQLTLYVYCILDLGLISAIQLFIVD